MYFPVLLCSFGSKSHVKAFQDGKHSVTNLGQAAVPWLRHGKQGGHGNRVWVGICFSEIPHHDDQRHMLQSCSKNKTHSLLSLQSKQIPKIDSLMIGQRCYFLISKPYGAPENGFVQSLGATSTARMVGPGFNGRRFVAGQASVRFLCRSKE